MAIWGDAGPSEGQSVWIDDLSVTLGGPVEIVPEPGEANPYDEETIEADPTIRRPAVIYSQDNVPPAPKLEDLPLRESISQYGITWTFEQPAHVGQFVNGDWYVVGPVTIKTIDPQPLYGKEISKRQLDGMDKERPEVQRVRNGFMLNPPAQMKVAYDSGVRNWFDPSLIQRLPVTMKPGGSLVSTISMPKGLILQAQLRNRIERGADDSSPIHTAAVLSSVSEPQPPDAFRPVSKQAGLGKQLTNQFYGPLKTLFAIRGGGVARVFASDTLRPGSARRWQLRKVHQIWSQVHHQ